MNDRIYDIKNKLLDTLANSEENDIVKYFIDGKEVSLKFECSQTDNGQVKIYFSQTDGEPVRNNNK